jgi:hypothetical protein
VTFSNAVSAMALVLAAVSAGAAIYAVKTSRNALDWEKSRANTDVRIAFSHRAETVEPIMTLIDDRPAQPTTKYYRLEVEVINEGEVAEFITGLWLATTDLADVTEHHLDVDHELKPRARVRVHANMSELRQIASGTFVAFASLASGTVVKSAEERLREGIQAEVT